MLEYRAERERVGPIYRFESRPCSYGYCSTALCVHTGRGNNTWSWNEKLYKSHCLGNYSNVIIQAVRAENRCRAPREAPQFSFQYSVSKLRHWAVLAAMKWMCLEMTTLPNYPRILLLEPWFEIVRFCLGDSLYHAGLAETSVILRQLTWGDLIFLKN